MRRWLEEPLLHFLLAGGLLFAAYTWLDQGSSDAPRVVQITAAEVNWLKESWARQRLRPPDGQELRGLVTDYLKEQLLAREAKELGLDEDDTIVRRRLAQKMAFLVQDAASLSEPSEAVLRQFYDSQRDRYRIPARVSFSQRFFKTEAAARRALDTLKSDQAAEVGDPSLLEQDYSQLDNQAIASLFGSELTDTLSTLIPHKWHGPLASSYGFHLVWVSERQAGQDRTFEQVRVQVHDEWQRVQQLKANEQFFDRLLSKYDIIVDEEIRPLIGPLAGVSP